MSVFISCGRLTDCYLARSLIDAAMFMYPFSIISMSIVSRCPVEGGRTAFELIPNSTFNLRVRRDLPSFGARLLVGDVGAFPSLSEADLADDVVLISDTTTSPPTSPDPLTRPLGATVVNKTGA